MKPIAIYLLVLVAAGAAHAQPAAIPLTLDEAIQRATDASHRLAEARAREQGAQAAIEVRRAAERPTVTVSGGYTRTNHVDEFGVVQPDGQLRVIYPDIPDNYFTRASFHWPIYTSGRLDALERAAEAEARAVGAELQAARADLRLEVVRAYWALVTATDSVRVLEDTLDRSNAHLRDVRAMFDAGLVPPSDVSSVEAQRARQQMLLIEAQNLRRGAAEELKRLTGLSGVAEIAVTSVPFSNLRPLREPPSQPGTSVPALLETALKQRAERQALRDRVEAAEDRQAAAAAGRRPTVALAGGVDYANPNPRIFPRKDEWRESWDVSVNVTWPLWDGGRSKAETAEAAAAASAIRARLADLDTMIALDIRQRQLDIDSAQAAIAAAEEGIRSAQETRRVVAERFRVGVGRSTEMLDAQVALLQAELDRLRAIASLRLADARLDRAVGR